MLNMKNSKNTWIQKLMCGMFLGREESKNTGLLMIQKGIK